METKLDIRTNNLESFTPLYLHYSGQINYQPGYVELDQNGVVRAGTQESIGNSMPMSWFHGTDIAWGVSGCVQGKALKAFLESDEAIKLLERVYNGHETEWDGHNWVGKLDEDAEEAQAEFETLLDELPTVSVLGAGEYLYDAKREIGITANTTDEELQEMADTLESDAEADDILLEGTLDCLQEWRDHLKVEQEDEE